MTNPLFIIKRGESFPFKFDRGGRSIESWTCQIIVKQFPGDTATIDRGITADGDNAFSGYLTHTETVGLIQGLWHITGILINVGTDEREEIPERFNVSQTWSS